MSFKLNVGNANGSIKINLHRELSSTEMAELCLFAESVLNAEQMREQVFGPIQEPIAKKINIVNKLETESRTYFSQDKLGEKPVKEINLGTYNPPEDGVRLRLFSMVSGSKTAAIKVLREATGITLTGCKEILFGNHICPVLTLETARAILEQFKANGEPHARIIPARASENCP